MSAEWWPVHNGVAGAAVPPGVSSSAVTETRDVPNQN
jgi:hypothetical protein